MVALSYDLPTVDFLERELLLGHYENLLHHFTAFLAVELRELHDPLPLPGYLGTLRQYAFARMRVLTSTALARQLLLSEETAFQIIDTLYLGLSDGLAQYQNENDPHFSNVRLESVLGSE